MNQESKLVILGAGLFAEEVAEYAGHSGYELIGFVEGLDRKVCDKIFRGLPVYWIEDEFLSQAGLCAVCAVGSPKRKQLIARAAEKGIRFTKLVHPSATLALDVKKQWWESM
jgi:hypothetical protein